MGNWKKAENDKGFLYYINLDTNKKQWDHPKFSDVKQAIDDCNYVTYPLYRLALKFRVLQRSFYMEELPLSIITATFDRHRLGNNESSLTLETYDLEAVLSDIFFAANKKNHTNIDIDFATEIVINFLFNVYDQSREGNIQVFATKMLLGILSSCSLLDIYKFLFLLCVDHNNCITRLRLHGLLVKIFEIIKYLHEDVSVGFQSINAAVESCFRTSPGLVGITESSFIGWLESGPPFLSWLSLIEKLKSSETVMHSIKCTTCKTRPLMGLRYRCIKCSRFTQCQRCFLTGRLSHSHKLSHSVREYDGVSKSKDNSGIHLGNLCRLFCPLAVNKHFSVVKPIKCFTIGNTKPHQPAVRLCDVEPLSSPQSQLQGVIRQLESQNRELQQMLLFGNYSDKEMHTYLEEYRIFMAGNITKLKMLKDRINTATNSKVEEYQDPQLKNMFNIQSTPMTQFDKVGRCKSTVIENNISPVTTTTEIDESFGNDYVNINVENGISKLGIQSSNRNSKNYKNYNSGKKEIHYPVTESSEMEQKCEVFGRKSPVKLLHNDLDEALARLQQILANNFSLEDSLSRMDNTNLKYAVTEVEGMLTSIIDNVESSRSSSVLPPGRIKC